MGHLEEGVGKEWVCCEVVQLHLGEKMVTLS